VENMISGFGAWLRAVISDQATGSSLTGYHVFEADRMTE
jgi:hypothetical protein